MGAARSEVKRATAILTSRHTMCTRIIWINLSMIPHGHSHHHSKWSCHSKAARLLQRRTMRLLLSRIIRDNNQKEKVGRMNMLMEMTLKMKNTKKSRMVTIIDKEKMLISLKLSMIQCCNATMIQIPNHTTSSNRIEFKNRYKRE